MNYRSMAEELLHTRMEMLRVPANQQLAKMVQGELFVLNYLLTREEKTHPKDLSRKMTVSTARIAVVLNHMEDNGLIQRIDDPEDKRQVFVVLTDAGRELIEKKRKEGLEVVIKMLEYLGPEDAQHFIRIQRRIVNGFHQMI